MSPLDPIAPPARAAVIGAGPIGCTTAAALVRAGYEVAIYDIAASAVEPVQAEGAIHVQGVMQGRFPLRLASTNIGAVLEGARLVCSCVPASAHEAVAAAAGPHFEDGTLLMIQPGQTFSALTFLQLARDHGLRGELVPVEVLNSLYTCRLGRPGHVRLYAAKRSNQYAALPSTRTAWAGAILEPVFPSLTPAGSVLYISLHNLNAVVHPPITLLNAGPIDRGAPFLYYREGATRHVLRLTTTTDGERLAICAAFGLEGCFSVLDWYQRAYELPHDDLFDLMQALEAYRDISAPTSLQTRLLLEDIPTGVVPYCDLAERVGLAVPNLQGVLAMANTLYETDFRESGRTLERLGHPDLDVEGIRALLG